MSHETPSVTRYERDTNAVSNAAPHHTTPHHTTKNTSSRSVALAANRGIENVEHLAATIRSIRPDWTDVAIEAAIWSDDRPWRTVVAASIRGALLDGPDTIRHPNGLRYVNPAGDTTVERLPSVDDALNPELCPHGSRVGACPMCRQENRP